MAETSERRSHLRQRVVVPATLRGTGVAPRPAVLRDVAPGGFYLECPIILAQLEQPEGTLIGTDGVVVVEFSLDGDRNKYVVKGTASRISQLGLGVVVRSDTSNAVEALMRHAAAQGVAMPASINADPSVINGIKDALLAWLPARLRAFTEQSEARLVTRASQAHSNAEQTPYFDAITELKCHSTELETLMANTLLTRLDKLGASFQSVTPEAEIEGEGELSLVDINEFEIFLSVADMAAKAESRNDQALFEMSRRLSTIAGVTVDNDNNPLAPASLCDPYHNTMGCASVTPEALNIIYQCFDDLVLNELPSFYRRINNTLTEAGVMAVSEPAPAKPKIENWRSSQSRSKASEDLTETKIRRSDTKEIDESELLEVPSSDTVNVGASSTWLATNAWQSANAESTWRPDDPLSPPVVPADSEGQSTAVAGPAWLGVNDPFGNNPFSSETSQVPQAQSATPFAVPVRPGTAFGAAQSILNLNRTLAFAGGGASSTGGAHDSHVGPPAFDMEQLVAVLSSLQPQRFTRGEDSAEFAQGAADGRTFDDGTGSESASLRGSSFRARLHQALGELGGTSVPIGGFGLGLSGAMVAGPMGDAIELVMALFEAFRDDSEVSPELQMRLNALEPAVHKVALVDPSFFEFSEHPVRQLINQLARLRPELGDSDAPGGDLWDVADAVLNPVLVSFERDVSLFNDALVELDALVQRQSHTYQEAVGAVIAACSAQEAFILARRGAAAEANAESAAPAARSVSKEWAVWLNRAGRIEPGEQLDMGVGDDLKHYVLAWIGQGRSSFVFVDKRGEKSLTMSQQELAMQLRRGAATIARTQDLPLVDRVLSRVLQDLHRLLERRATRDASTGLLNRKSLLVRLRDALERNAEEGKGVALIAVAIEELDALDKQDLEAQIRADISGVLLRRVARRMSGILGDPANMACVDERLLMGLVMDVSSDRAWELATEISGSVAALRIRWGDEPAFSPTPHSCAIFASPGESPAAVLDVAEQALLNRPTVDEDQQDASAAEPEGILVRIDSGDSSSSDYQDLIRKVLSQEGVHLRCHRIAPLVAQQRNRNHFEVLLGIRGDNGEPIPAAEFVRAAEHFGHMPAVDRWVLRNMLNWMRGHRRWLRRVGGFAINLSGSSLSDPHLVEYVLELLNQSSVPPGKILFEVSDAIVVDNMSNAQNFLRTLSEVGCRFALSDFGSRQSAYSYLKQLPVDYVKIDGLYVRDIETGQADLAVVQSVNEIAHFMGKKTVAEFVQSPMAVERLREIGVDYGQGFYIDMPFYVEDATEEMLISSPPALSSTTTNTSTDEGDSEGN